MAFRICAAAGEHIEQIHEIEQDCFSLPWTEDMLRAQLSGERSVFLAAIGDGGEVLGYAGMEYVLDEGYISNVAVASAFRRQGVADGLMEALRSRAEELGLAFISLEVRAGNEPAIRLYEKHGYRAVGRRKNYYERPREDALIMTKFLKRGADIENTGV